MLDIRDSKAQARALIAAALIPFAACDGPEETEASSLGKLAAPSFSSPDLGGALSDVEAKALAKQPLEAILLALRESGYKASETLVTLLPELNSRGASLVLKEQGPEAARAFLRDAQVVVEETLTADVQARVLAKVALVVGVTLDDQFQEEEARAVLQQGYRYATSTPTSKKDPSHFKTMRDLLMARASNHIRGLDLEGALQNLLQARELYASNICDVINIVKDEFRPDMLAREELLATGKKPETSLGDIQGLIMLLEVIQHGTTEERQDTLENLAGSIDELFSTANYYARAGSLQESANVLMEATRRERHLVALTVIHAQKLLAEHPEHALQILRRAYNKLSTSGRGYGDSGTTERTALSFCAALARAKVDGPSYISRESLLAEASRHEGTRIKDKGIPLPATAALAAFYEEAGQAKKAADLQIRLVRRFLESDRSPDRTVLAQAGKALSLYLAAGDVPDQALAAANEYEQIASRILSHAQAVSEAMIPDPSQVSLEQAKEAREAALLVIRLSSEAEQAGLLQIADGQQSFESLKRMAHEIEGVCATHPSLRREDQRLIDAFRRLQQKEK